MSDPPGVVTETFPSPAACAGVVAVSEVPAGLVETTAAGAPPTLTCMPARNPDPVRVTVVPPEAGPWAGLTEVNVGAAR